MARSRLGRFADYAAGISSGGPAGRYVGWVGHDNLGDEALVEAVSRYFEPIRLVADVPAPLRRLDDRIPIRLAVLGGGTLLGARQYWRRFEGLRKRSEVAVAFGAGVEDPAFPNTRSVGAREAALLSNCDYVGVRGPRSETLLAALGVEVEVLGDPIFCFVQADSFWTPTGRVLGVNIGATHGQMWGGSQRYLELMADLVSGAVAQGWSVEYFTVWPDDLGPTRHVMAESGTETAHVHEVYESAASFLEVVRGCQVFVGTRMHAVALSLCAGVPSVMLEYRPKCRDLMDSIDLGDLCLRLDRTDAESTLDLVTGLADDPARERTTGMDRMRTFRGLQEARARSILDMAGGA